MNKFPIENKKAMGEQKMPTIGEKVFASIYNNRPILITIKGFQRSRIFSGDLVEYVDDKGRENASPVKETVFFEHAPIDSDYIYIVEMEQHEFMEQSEFIEIAFFFNPKAAFDYIDSIEHGLTMPQHKISKEFFTYSVKVHKV